jgi:catechol 2,3-dioxygenase-like lactoylglutathione lyase family enzyme
MESSNPAGVRQAVPLYLVRHMQACIDFYVKGLGFDVTNTWLVDGEIRWCWMSMGDAAMMFQELAPALTSPNGTDQKLGLGVELCLQCDNALLMYERAMANKLAVQDPFVGNNMWVVSLRDPDGYKLSFESPTDVPEGTTYQAWNKLV